MQIRLPPGLAEQRELGPDWADWLDRLPALFAEVLDDWHLTRDDAQLWHGFCSLVAPVHTTEGDEAVLKVSFLGDDESLHEAQTLQLWDGDGAVRLLRADPARRALLLERLHRRDLTSLDPLAACRVVAGLYPRLHRPAGPDLAGVVSFVERWLDALARMPHDAAIPARYVERALATGRDLVADPASVGRIVHGDLHYENVLAADREPWLAIDPKPMSGDPHYEPAPMLWNRFEELGPDVGADLRRRFDTLVDAAALDPERARAWVVVRMVLNAHWSVEDAERAGRALHPEERRWIEQCLTIVDAIDP